ncbi:MAG TPA: heme-binding protein [Stellaceae bacterium]|nr:heme-binding protein [Stellaceae bacterium]
MSKGMTLFFTMAALALGGAALARAQTRPITPYGPAISLGDAEKVAAAAIEEAKKVSIAPDAIAIVDPGGALVYFARMDDTQIGSVKVAIGKARSAALFRRPTKVFADLLAKGNAVPLGLEGAVPLEGGIPLISGGKLVGAIGASGGTGAQDGQVAEAGAAMLRK